MDRILEKWWEIFDEASQEGQIILQTWIYGLFCYIQDSQEAEDWIPIPFEELFDYANEFMDLSKEEANDLKESLVNLRLKPLLTDDDFNKILQIFVLDTEKIPEGIYIIKDLLTGEDLSEEVKTRVMGILRPLPQFQPLQEQKRKHLQTRRIHGRRSITPIKRKHGRRAITAKICVRERTS
jgi:DNA-directed RNA polymerase subunit F